MGIPGESYGPYWALREREGGSHGMPAPAPPWGRIGLGVGGRTPSPTPSLPPLSPLVGGVLLGVGVPLLVGLPPLLGAPPLGAGPLPPLYTEGGAPSSTQLT
jgi:hypothetical protein